MGMTNVIFKMVSLLERPEMEDPLLSRGLSINDFTTACKMFVFKQHEEIVATGGMEVYGDSVLFRSIAVLEQLEGNGLGGKMVGELERLARDKKAKGVYLVTEGSDSFFEHFGFEPVLLEEVPEYMQGHCNQFNGGCPPDAIIMRKWINKPEPVEVLFTEEQKAEEE